MESLYQSSEKTCATAAEVAEILYPVAGFGPVDEAGNIYTVCKDEMNKLIYASLDFIRFKNDKEEFLDELPEELGLNLKDRVEAECQAFLDNLELERMIADAEAGVFERTCALRMYKFFERFYSVLSSSSVFIDLKHKFE